MNLFWRCICIIAIGTCTCKLPTPK